MRVWREKEREKRDGRKKEESRKKKKGRKKEGWDIEAR